MPDLQNICQRYAGKHARARERPCKLFIIRNDALNLRLLEHDFRNKNLVRVAGCAPRQVGARFFVIVSPGLRDEGTKVGFLLPHKKILPCKNPPPLAEGFWTAVRKAYAFGRASETVSIRPPNSLPFHMAIAPSAPASSAISTKPKPRERPVSRSVTIEAVATSPAWAKASRSSSPVVRYGRPPTKSLRSMNYEKQNYLLFFRKATLPARGTWRLTGTGKV